MTMCTFRFKRQLRRRRDGNSYSGRRWSNGGWRRFWSFSSSWTSWVKTTSDRSWNEPMPPVRLCSPRLTSLPWMSFTSSLGLRGTTTWGMLVSNRASDHKLFVPTWAFTCDSQVDRPIRSGIATLVGAAGRPGQGRGRNNLYDSLTLDVLVSVGLFLTWDFLFSPDKTLKDILHKVLCSGYFDRAQTHPNGTCQEEEEQEEPPAVAESQDGGQPSEPGTDYIYIIYICVSVRFYFTRVKKLFYYSISCLKKDQLVKNTQSLFKWKPQRLVC